MVAHRRILIFDVIFYFELIPSTEYTTFLTEVRIEQVIPT